MIESLNATSDIPLLLRGLCYLGGMALYISTLLWLARVAFGVGNNLSLRQITGIWGARMVAACALASLSMMIYTGRIFAEPFRAAPEIAILMLLAALYLLIEKRRFLKRRHILINRLPGEIINITGVTLACIAGLFVVVGFLQLAVRIGTYAEIPDWMPVFAVGLLALAPLIALFIAAKECSTAEKLKFYKLLFPVLVACFLIMLPDLIQHLRSSPKIDEFLHARPRLQRAETGAGKSHNYS